MLPFICDWILFQKACKQVISEREAAFSSAQTKKANESLNERMSATNHQTSINIVLFLHKWEKEREKKPSKFCGRWRKLRESKRKKERKKRHFLTPHTNSECWTCKSSTHRTLCARILHASYCKRYFSHGKTNCLLWLFSTTNSSIRFHTHTQYKNTSPVRSPGYYLHSCRSLWSSLRFLCLWNAMMLVWRVSLAAFSQLATSFICVCVCIWVHLLPIGCYLIQQQMRLHTGLNSDGGKKSLLEKNASF